MNQTRELDSSEVVAVLMPGLDDDGERAAIIIVRGASGQVSVCRIDGQDPSMHRAAGGIRVGALSAPAAIRPR